MQRFKRLWRRLVAWFERLEQHDRAARRMRHEDRFANQESPKADQAAPRRSGEKDRKTAK